MALGTDGFTSSDLDVLIPAIWGEKLNDYFRSEIVMASFFTDRSDELSEGGDTLHTPDLTAMSSNSKSTNSEVTLKELGVKLLNLWLQKLVQRVALPLSGIRAK